MRQEDDQQKHQPGGRCAADGSFCEGWPAQLQSLESALKHNKASDHEQHKHCRDADERQNQGEQMKLESAAMVQERLHAVHQQSV
jgi:hypothetical protein